MPWVAAAAVGGAVISGYASNKAADTQAEAAGNATAEQQRQYDLTRQDTLANLAQSRSDQAPWLSAGQSAIGNLSAGLAPGGQYTQRFTGVDLQNEPGYQFQLAQGDRAINAAAGAKGGLYSGATLKALDRFNQNTASSAYGAAYDRFNNDQTRAFNQNASIAGVGQQANNNLSSLGSQANSTLANAGMNSANNISNNITGAGNANASGYVGAANALTGGIGQALNYNQNQQLLSKLGNNGSGYSGWANSNSGLGIDSSDLQGAF